MEGIGQILVRNFEFSLDWLSFSEMLWWRGPIDTQIIKLGVIADNFWISNSRRMIRLIEISQPGEIWNC